MNAILSLYCLLLLGVASSIATPKELQELDLAFKAIVPDKNLALEIEKITTLQKAALALKDSKYKYLLESIYNYV